MYQLLILLCVAFSVFRREMPKLPYDLKKAELKLTLPLILQEISGITILDSTTIACVQDENGILFLYDFKKASIKRQITFSINGDYEGITKVNQTLYILRSDGVIFEIADYTASKLIVKEYKTGIPAINNEGLCYDATNKRLLIGAKGKINKDPGYKNQRFIYEFNLATKMLNQKPLFNFNTIEVNLLAKMNGVEFKKHKNKKGEVHEIGLKFNTSEIAIHPITKELYILSANDHCLFICSSKGELVHIEQLSPITFNKAEGLSFFPNGDVLISNEGQAHQPTLLKFNYKP